HARNFALQKQAFMEQQHFMEQTTEEERWREFARCPSLRTTPHGNQREFAKGATREHQGSSPCGAAIPM
ncbi:MAG: hypothetical protein WAR76_04310, partial [Xanthobacteraceae bacterium]